MLKWLRYSGMSIILSLNPLWWKVLPWFRNETTNEWPNNMGKTFAFGFLGVTIRIWLDNGKW